METSLEELEIEVQMIIYEQIPIICAKIAKIGSADLKIICNQAITNSEKN